MSTDDACQELRAAAPAVDGWSDPHTSDSGLVSSFRTIPHARLDWVTATVMMLADGRWCWWVDRTPALGGMLTGVDRVAGGVAVGAAEAVRQAAGVR